MPELPLPSIDNTNWYSHYTALHHRINGYGAIVYRTDTRTIAVDRYGQIISDLATTATNNSTVIQAAIDAVAGTYNNGTGDGVTFGHGGGGTVKLSDQFFAITNRIELKWGVSLEGTVGTVHRRGFAASTYSQAGTCIAPTSGLGTLDIDPSATTTTRRPVILVGRSDASSNNELLTNPHGTFIRDLTVDTRQITTAQCVVVADTRNVTIERCLFYNASSTGGVGVDIVTTNPYHVDDNDSLGVTISNCNIVNCTLGVNATGAGLGDCHLYNNRITATYDGTVRIASTGSGAWQIHGNHFTAAGTRQTGTNQGHIVIGPGVGPVVISHNYLDTTGGWSILTESIGTVITGNYIKMSSSNTKVAPIRLLNAGRLSTITGNFGQAAGTATRAMVTINTDGNQYERRTVVAGNMMGNKNSTDMTLGAQFTGIVCDPSGAAVAEANSAMSTVIADLNSTANQFIWGNRLVVSQV
jgi:hypothetical protein